jgi:hypothetical protein
MALYRLDYIPQGTLNIFHYWIITNLDRTAISTTKKPFLSQCYYPYGFWVKLYYSNIVIGL